MTAHGIDRSDTAGAAAAAAAAGAGGAGAGSTYLLSDGSVALAGAWDLGGFALTNVNIDSGTLSGITSAAITAATITAATITTATINGGTITGITDLAVADGGTGASDADTALKNLISAATALSGTIDGTDSLALYNTSNAVGAKITVTNFLTVVNTLTADASPDPTADYVMTYDASASAAKKVLVQDIAPGQQAGQCRLNYTSSTVLTLSRFNGKHLFINGAWYAIPSAGVTLGNGGLSASTRYYVYAYMSGGTMTLEASTTIYAQDSTTGVMVKSGDSTRTLVGQFQTTAGSIFYDANPVRLVSSYFNRRPKEVVYHNSAAGFTSTSLTAFDGTSVQGSALFWGDEAINITCSLAAYNTAGTTAYFAALIQQDGGALGSSTYACPYVGGSINSTASVSWSLTPTLGYHYFTAVSQVDAGTISFQAGSGFSFVVNA